MNWRTCCCTWCALEKIALNAAKYPARQVRGDARKYDQYD
jgi:hypothetical protein